MSNSEKRETVALKPNHVGWFAWERGLKGPCPVKISSGRVPYLSREEWNKLTIAAWPLTFEEWALPLDELAKHYPLP